MWGALALGALSAGGSLLSGIGAKQSSAKQARLQIMADETARYENNKQLQVVNTARETLGREMLGIPETNTESVTEMRGSWVDTDAMMAAAERSGFNPVTWLNAGGMQAYTQAVSDVTRTQTRTGHNVADAYKLMVPEYALQQASQVPQQHSMLSAFGGALTAGANAFGTQYRADQSYDLQMGKLLAGMALGGVNQGMGLSQGNGLMTALMSPGSGARGGTGGAAALTGLPYPLQWKTGDVDVTTPWYSLRVDPRSADAETFEARYGDIAQEIAGAYNFANDMTLNLSGSTIGGNVSNWWNTVPGSGATIGVYDQNTPWTFRGTPGMRWLFGAPGSAPYMRSGSAAP